MTSSGYDSRDWCAGCSALRMGRIGSWLQLVKACRREVMGKAMSTTATRKVAGKRNSVLTTLPARKTWTYLRALSEGGD